MKALLALIPAALAVAGCAAPGTAAPGTGQGTQSRRIELTAGASVLVTEDPLAASKTFVLEGVTLETDGIVLEFRPEVNRDGDGMPHARIRFEGTVHGPRWSVTPPPDPDVLPVITGTTFIRMIGDRASVSFYREHALEFSHNGPDPVDPYRFSALFSIEPPVLKSILAADEFLLAGEDPDWRVLFGDSQKEACRLFLELALGGEDGTEGSGE